MSIDEYLKAIPDDVRREDCGALIALMQKATGEPPKIWGGGMVGFGTYHYKYASGHEGDWFLAGFALRKKDLTLYVMPCSARHSELIAKLGKFKAGKACIYIKQLADIDQSVLQELVTESVEYLRREHGGKHWMQG
ncbi:MAG: DUF1801 domain-containing protein [Candidatus Hydrogenedentes bacterium]|nr:DUF1801 domain-containing protein [Candidatus Hydrogenedentota bacterium]